MRRNLFLASITLLLALPLPAKTFMTQQQALDSAFSKGAALERQSIFLSPDEARAAKSASGVEFEDGLVVRYVGRVGGAIVGYVYFDAHRVRTLPETLMIVVRSDGAIDRIEILSFSEPEDYLPKPRWIDQLDGKKLDAELSLKRSIRPISGATLSGRAIVNASRKILAIHGVVQARPVPKGKPAR
ncbi:MAG: FMN-binding protein [Acidobacteria bacterium]|nr:FMN-binding protein [Acidobacteriota bacterium]